MTTINDALTSVYQDPDATLDQRDAADITLRAIKIGVPPPRECIDTLRGYVASQTTQNRYGK